jgi:hypothetical protein
MSAACPNVRVPSSSGGTPPVDDLAVGDVWRAVRRFLQCLVTRGTAEDSSQPGVRPCADVVTYRDLTPGICTFRVRSSGGAAWLAWPCEVLPR